MADGSMREIQACLESILARELEQRAPSYATVSIAVGLVERALTCPNAGLATLRDFQVRLGLGARWRSSPDTLVLTSGVRAQCCSARRRGGGGGDSHRPLTPVSATHDPPKLA